MTRHETAIAERLHDAASRIPVDADATSVIEPARTPLRRRRVRRPTVAAGVAVAAAAAAAVMLVVGRAPGSDTLETGPPVASAPTPGSSSTAAEPVAAHVASPPDWFGEPEGAYRDWDSVLRTGRWVSMAIGRVTGDTIAEPVVISVFDGTYRPLADAESVVIDGTAVRSLRPGGWEGWEALATTDTPTVMVGGSVDRATLRAVLDAVEVVDPSGEFSLQLGTRPDGYTEIAPPQILGRQTSPGRVLVSSSGHTGIDGITDRTDPLLAAAFSGADLTAADVAGRAGWLGRTSSPQGPVRFLVWSPRPGVVFEMTTDDPDVPEPDLVDLALSTTAIGIDDWDVIYGD